MRSVVAAGRHLCGLFVDDESMAIAILAWLILDGLLAQLIGVAPTWRGPVLLVGLAALLSWACFRSTRRRR